MAYLALGVFRPMLLWMCALALLVCLVTVVRSETSVNGFRVFGEDDDFETITSRGQWMMLLTHKKAGVKEESAAAEEVVKKAAASLATFDLPFELTKVDCFEFPDPCLDYGAKKRYPFIALNFPKSIKKGIQFRSGQTPEASPIVSTADELKIYEQIERIPTVEDFYERTASGQWLVMLHPPFEQSKHSRDSLSMWRSVARWAARNKTLSVASFLCNQESATLCENFVNMTQPRALPTIFLLDGMYADEYDGLWSQEEVLNWWRTTITERAAKLADDNNGSGDDEDKDDDIKDEL